MDPNRITYFGETDARNKKIKFGIKAKDRLKHVYVIGKTGMGKSTLLENMAIQDIQNGEGIAVIDPHGSMAEKLLEYVPEHRVKDVLYFAPFDMEYPVSFNVMEDVGEDKRHLVVNGLMSTFEKIWVDAWSARMAYILSNTLLALLEYPGSTLLGVNRMLSDKEYRRKVVENVKDTSVKAFWVDEFGKWTEKFIAEAIPAIQNKVGQFTSNPLVRNLLGQAKSSFDMRKIMDEKKIFIVNLSKGRVGEGNANLIGSMLITKLYLAAMSRADADEATLAKLPSFYLFVDEFQSFANKSFADILSEARKYKLSLTIAHQYIEQMEEEVRNAVFGNVGTMITFRVGAFDAEVLEKEFAPVFTAEDLVNLGFTQIYLKLMIDGVSSQPFSSNTLGPIGKPEVILKNEVIEASRAQFARPRADVEKQIADFHQATPTAQPGQNRMGQEGGMGNGQDRRPNTPMGNGYGAPEKRFDTRTDNRPYTPFRPETRPDHKLATVTPDHMLGSGGQMQQKAVFQQDKVVVPATVPDSEKNNEHKLAFMKAAVELKSREQQNPTAFVKPEPIKPVQPTEKRDIPFQREASLSLQDLKPVHERAKIPTPENISSLKNALSSVLLKKPDPVIEPKKEPSIQPQPQPKPVVQAPIEKTEHVPIQEKKIQDIEVKKPASTPDSYEPLLQSTREVPEDVLRNLLAL
jgi:energy-coupling factor transporter ATP-binding protein EcfA2